MALRGDDGGLREHEAALGSSLGIVFYSSGLGHCIDRSASGERGVHNPAERECISQNYCQLDLAQELNALMVAFSRNIRGINAGRCQCHTIQP